MSTPVGPPSSAGRSAVTPMTASAAASAAPGPPSRAIAKIQEDASAHPEEFNGRSLTVEGLYVGTKRRNIGALVGDGYHPHFVVDVVIADSKDDLAHSVWCEMNTWTPPPGLAELDRVVVEGRAYLDTPANGRKLVIGNCTLKKGT